MVADLNTSPYAGTALKAVDVTQLLEVLRRLTNWEILGTFAATLSTAATTFTALGGTSSVAFTKVGGATDTDVLCFLSSGAFKTTTTVGVEWAIGDGTTDWLIQRTFFNTLVEHLAQGIGTVRMTGLAAGAYTLQVKARCMTAVTGALTVNSGDNISLLAMEVPTQ